MARATSSCQGASGDLRQFIGPPLSVALVFASPQTTHTTREGRPANFPQKEPPTVASQVDLLAAFTSSMEQARSYLADLSDERATATWQLVAGDRNLMAAPRAAILRSLLFNHWYHHRGQLVVYPRLLDVPVPSVQGLPRTRIRLLLSNNGRMSARIRSAGERHGRYQHGPCGKQRGD